MTVTIKVEGGLNNKHESIDAELDVPPDWKPTFETFCKVKGTLRYLEEKLAQEFEPKSNLN